MQGAAEKHYPTMSIADLCVLPVANIAAEDSTLFLWATFPQLPTALKLIRAWGFTYKTIRFLYKGIIIKHNKTEPTYTKTSLFLCEKRRFFMARTEKGVVATI